MCPMTNFIMNIFMFFLISINLIKKHGLEVFDIEKLETHGGSLRYYIKRKSNNKLKLNNKVKRQFHEELKFQLINIYFYQV